MTAGRLVAWGVGLLIVLRLAYLGLYLRLPFLFGPLFDSQVYLEQAWAVRAGRFGDPTLLAFSPLYGYFLALLGPAPGDLLPIAVQLALGVGNVLLVARITRHCLGARAAPWAAAAWALYGPVLLFETKLMSETLGLALLLLGLERYASPAFARARPAALATCGAALALAVLARASLLFSLPCFVACAWLRAPAEDTDAAEHAAPPRRLALSRALGLCLVIALVLGSYGLFTRAHSGLFVPVIMVSDTVRDTTRTDWSGDLSSFRAKDEAAVGAFSVVTQARARLKAIQRGEPDPADRRAALAGIDLLGFLRKAPAKLWLTLRDVETSFDYGFYGERSEIALLYLTCVTFGMLASMAALGSWLVWRAGAARSLVALLPLVLGILATTTLFHPSTRYRLPLVAAFAPLAGFAWAEGVAACRAGKRGLLLALTVLSVGFVARGTLRGLDHPGSWQLRVAEAAAMSNDLPECRARVHAALQLEPSQEVRARSAYIGSLLPACVSR